jgi:hypothetical protein
MAFGIHNLFLGHIMPLGYMREQRGLRNLNLKISNLRFIVITSNLRISDMKFWSRMLNTKACLLQKGTLKRKFVGLTTGYYYAIALDMAVKKERRALLGRGSMLLSSSCPNSLSTSS